MSTIAALVGVFLLTAATGYFVAQEFAFVAADRAALAAAGDKRSRRALEVTARLSFMLSGAQLGITVTALVVGFLAAPAAADLLEPLLDSAGVPGAGAIALVAGFAVATVVQMVLGELLPKNLALTRPERLARALAPSTLRYLAVAGPVITVFDRAAAGVVRRFGVEPVEELQKGANLEELGDIIGESGRSGHLPPDLSRLLERALAFGDLTVDEVMVPRTKVIAVPGGSTVGDFVALVQKAGHTHYPVYGEGVDDLLGVVSLTDIGTDLAAPLPIRPALLVPGSVRLRQVVEQMRAARQEFACVADEYGGLAGIVTFEDIAEELVGDIADENDPAAPAVVAAGDGTWLADAVIRVDEFATATGVELPSGEAYETVNGLIMQRLGRLPVRGDLVSLPLEPQGTASIEVLTVTGRSAKQVRVHVEEAT